MCVWTDFLLFWWIWFNHLTRVSRTLALFCAFDFYLLGRCVVFTVAGGFDLQEAFCCLGSKVLGILVQWEKISVVSFKKEKVLELMLLS